MYASPEVQVAGSPRRLSEEYRDGTHRLFLLANAAVPQGGTAKSHTGQYIGLFASTGLSCGFSSSGRGEEAGGSPVQHTLERGDAHRSSSA